MTTVLNIADAEVAVTQAAPLAPVRVKGPSSGRLRGLDGLRAVSILLVVLYHCQHIGPITPIHWIESAVSYGNMGVSVFFVLSGFLITWLLLREETGSGRISLKRFYVRRAFRILPPAIAFLAAVAVLSFFGRSLATWHDLASAAFFFRNLTGGSVDTNHFWTLAIEEQFYILWPFLMLWLPRRQRVPVTVALVLMAPLWRQVNYMMFTAEGLKNGRFDLRYDGLLIGCLLAIAAQSPRARRLLNLRFLHTGWAFAILVIAVCGTVAPPVRRLPGFVTFLFPTIQYLCFALMINRLALGTGEGTLLDWVFGNPVVVWLGQLSFSLYLWQELFCERGAALATAFPLNALLALGCAAASFYLIERPALALRVRIGSRSAAG